MTTKPKEELSEFNISNKNISAQHYISYLGTLYKGLAPEVVTSIENAFKKKSLNEFNALFFKTYGEVIAEKTATQYSPEFEKQVLSHISSSLQEGKTIEVETGKVSRRSSEVLDQSEDKVPERVAITQEEIDKCKRIINNIQPKIDDISKISNFFIEKTGRKKKFPLGQFANAYRNNIRTIDEIKTELRSETHHPDRLKEYEEQIDKILDEIYIGAKHAYSLYNEYLLTNSNKVKIILAYIKKQSIVFTYKNIQLKLWEETSIKGLLNEKGKIDSIQSLLDFHDKYEKFLLESMKKLQRKEAA